jgi:hypothetical protein
MARFVGNIEDLMTTCWRLEFPSFVSAGFADLRN